MLENVPGNDESSPLILIVDDNPSNIKLLEKIFRMENYRIINTNDPTKTVELYQNFSVDLIILDLEMPVLNGFEVMKKLSEVKEDDYIPVIVITAQNDHEYRLKALSLGAKDFITKPFDNLEVLMRIRNMLEMRLLHNKVRRHNIELEEKVLERTNEVYKTQFELFERLLKAAEFRDNDTGEHINRIGYYAYRFSKLVGADENFCNNILYASMMHDIGKIGIPDEILLSNDKLDSTSWEIMKTHTIKGAQILAGSQSEVIKMAERIALSHHERWDGLGYPYGLKKEEIPLEGRITSICDVFDALLSKRPYKEAWKLEDALEQIKEYKGNRFDPTLVDIFLTQIDKILIE